MKYETWRVIVTQLSFKEWSPSKIRLTFTKIVSSMIKGSSLSGTLTSGPSCGLPRLLGPLFPYSLIALCGIIYERLSKVLANRIRPHLGSLIQQEQFSFVSHCSIPNNILIANKLIHSRLYSKSLSPLLIKESSVNYSCHVRSPICLRGQI